MAKKFAWVGLINLSFAEQTFWNTNNGTKSKEAGNEFEKKAYGGVVYGYNQAVTVLINKNIENKNPKRYKYK